MLLKKALLDSELGHAEIKAKAINTRRPLKGKRGIFLLMLVLSKQCDWI